MRSAKGIWHCNKTKLTDKSPCRRYKNCCPLTSFVSFVRLLFFSLPAMLGPCGRGHYFILSKPSPNTPWQNVCENMAWGSIFLI